MVEIVETALQNDSVPYSMLVVRVALGLWLAQEVTMNGLIDRQTNLNCVLHVSLLRTTDRPNEFWRRLQLAKLIYDDLLTIGRLIPRLLVVFASDTKL